MEKKNNFYTFAYLSNVLSIIETHKDTSLEFNKIYTDFGIWMAENLNIDTALKFMAYHKNGLGNGTEKIYFKKKFKIEI